MKLPTFLGIGAGRSGTRWLVRCLGEHPQVYAYPDETYFFSPEMLHSTWQQGLEWYSSLFSKGVLEGIEAWGEITPVYLFSEIALDLIHRYLPNVKLICTLRQQVDWIHSLYRVFLRYNPYIYRTDFSFSRYLRAYPYAIQREGFYLEYLQRYLKKFSRDQFLILLYDDLKKDPISYIQQVFSFLGIDDSFQPPSLYEQVNPMHLTVTRSDLLREVLMCLSKHSCLTRFSHLLSNLNSAKIKRSEFPTRHRITPEIRSELAKFYSEHNQQLGSFLGRDLSHWNSKGVSEDG